MSLVDVKVSIITPAFNCESYILETINSVLNQTHSNFEIIIVDDNSTDKTVDVINTIKDPRIILVKNDTNHGAAYCRNLAISKASGDYIAFLDGDDIWFPTKLEKQLNFMIENDFLFSCTEYEIIDDKGMSKGIKITCPKKVTRKMMRRSDYIGCLTVMYKRSLFSDLSIPVSIKKRNDYALWLKLSEKADCYCLAEVLAKYRKRNSSLSSSKFKLIKYHAQVFKEIYGYSSLKSWFNALINCYFYLYRRLFYKKKILPLKSESRSLKEPFLTLEQKIFIYLNVVIISLGFFFGYKNSSINQDALFLNAINFIGANQIAHVEIEAKTFDGADYNAYDEICRDLYGRRHKFRSYCSSVNTGELDYQGNKYDAKLCSVPVYNDFELTEYLYIPLYRNNSSIKKGAKNGAKFASYIPSSLADKLLDDFSYSSYDELLEDNKIYQIRFQESVTSMSINNIYFDGESKNWMPEKNKENGDIFGGWSQGAVFTYAKSFFEDINETKLCLNIDKSYAHLQNISKSSYGKLNKELSVKVVDSSFNSFCFDYSVNDSKDYLHDSTHISIYCSFAVLVLLDALLIILLKDLRKNLLRPCFMISGLALSSLIIGEVFKSIFKLSLLPYTIFNSFGTVFSFIFILILFIFALLFEESLEHE